jgi:predicted dehydrogenase
MAEGKLRFGVISTALINDKVVPPMVRGRHCTVLGLASRDLGRAKAAAAKYGLQKAYGSYEEMLADPEIDAVYNPLPNHLHVEWSVKAAEAGKHVLCEKPIGLTPADVQTLMDARDRTGKRIQEAFMVRTHPQWVWVRDAVKQGKIGELRAVQGFFSYFLTDPSNIRNMADIGGGGMYDIGCYPITTSRFVTEREPKRVVAMIDRDPVLKVDRLGAVILDFGGIQGSFAYSTQLVPYQRMQFFGTTGRIEVEIPFNAPADRPCRIFIDDGSHTSGLGVRTIEIPTVDQYGVAGDAFAKSILEGTPQPVPLENSLGNMKVIDACFRSAESGGWVTL